MSEFTDEQLVNQYLNAKDERILEELVKRYLPLIYGFVRRYTGNNDNTSDITQETFVKVWKNLISFDQSKSFRTWIFTIAKHTAINWLKKKNALPFSVFENEQGENKFIDSLADDSLSIFEKLLLNETSRELAAATAKLPADYGTVIGLRVRNDLTFHEISKMLKEPLNTIKSRYRRGLVLLKKILIR